MNADVARRRPAEVLDARPLVVLTAVARPVTPRPPARPGRATSPADWPWSVVIALHVAATGMVITALWLLALYVGR